MKAEELKYKIESMEKRIKTLEKENEKLRDHVDERSNKSSKKGSEKISRRKFLNKLGAGVIGLGALTLSPASALEIKSDKFKVFAGTSSSDITEYFSVGQDGPVQILNADLELANGNLDLKSNTITDTSQNFLDITGDGNNLRLATDQSIEDEEGESRFQIASDKSILQDQNGNNRLILEDTGSIKFRPNNGTPVQIRDTYGGFDALKYSPKSSPPGKLELMNADLEAKSPNKIIASDVAFNGKRFLSIAVDPQNGDDSNRGLKNPVKSLDRALALADKSMSNFVTIECYNSSDNNRIMLNNSETVHGTTVIVHDGEDRSNQYFEISNGAVIHLSDSNFYMYYDDPDIGAGGQYNSYWHCFNNRMFFCHGDCNIGGGGYYNTTIYPRIDDWSLVYTHYDYMPGRVHFKQAFRLSIEAGSDNPDGSHSGARIHRGYNSRALFIYSYDGYYGDGGNNVDTTTAVDEKYATG